MIVIIMNQVYFPIQKKKNSISSNLTKEQKVIQQDGNNWEYRK